MPHAFQVLQALCRRIISGLCFWYVDSLMAVSRATLYINDSIIVNSQVQHLFGNGSIAIAKSQAGRCLELLDGDFTLNIKIQRYALEI